MSEGEVIKEIPGTMQTVGVLVFSKDNSKVLLVKHTEAAQNEEGIYGLPAGKIELGESRKEAAVRELMEETGLNATQDSLEKYEGNYFGAYITRTKGQVIRHAHMEVFHCTAYEGVLKDDKKTIPEWVEVSKISEFKTMPNIVAAVNNYLNSIR